MSRRRLTPALLAAAALVAPAVIATASPAATLGSKARGAGQVIAPVPEIDWGACPEGPDEDLSAFRCATVEVPTDYDRPGGRTTTIALTVLPASGGPERRLGTVFTNPGGPGGSGVEFIQQSALLIYPADLRERYDIVGFDPRGVGLSDPATCYPTQADEDISPLTRWVYPLPGRQEKQYVADVGQTARDCQRQSPGRFASASTANVARDLDLLRQAVGDERLTYIGYSYGTFLGATYARLFPGRVGRFVLDGAVDPVAWVGAGRGDAAPTVPLGIRIRQGVGAHETFGEFVRLCADAGPEGCPLAALGDPADVVHRTLDRLAVDPVVLPIAEGVEIVLDQQTMVALTFQSLYSPSTWPVIAELYAVLALPVPDPAEVAAVAAGTRSEVGARLRGEDYPSFGGALASLCVDTVNKARVRDYPDWADRADRRAPYFGRYRAWTGLPCEFWWLDDDDAYLGPWWQSTRAPVMVVGTRFDPATPYRQTRPYTDLFPDGRMVTLDGWGHTAIGKSTCVDDAIVAYLVGGRPPADGTVCRPDVDQPFAPSGARTFSTPRPDVPAGLPFW